MSETKKKVHTSTLLRRLFKTKSLSSYVKRNEASMVTESFSEYLKGLLSEKDMVAEQVINRSGIERTYGHQLFNGTRKPSRDKVLQIAVGFGLNYEETQKLLKIADKSVLYPKVKRDAAVIFALKNGYTILQLQQLLFDEKLTLLGESSKYEGIT